MSQSWPVQVLLRPYFLLHFIYIFRGRLGLCGENSFHYRMEILYTLYRNKFFPDWSSFIDVSTNSSVEWFLAFKNCEMFGQKLWFRRRNLAKPSRNQKSPIYIQAFNCGSACLFISIKLVRQKSRPFIASTRREYKSRKRPENVSLGRKERDWQKEKEKKVIIPAHCSSKL